VDHVEKNHTASTTVGTGRGRAQWVGLRCFVAVASHPSAWRSDQERYRGFRDPSSAVDPQQPVVDATIYQRLAVVRKQLASVTNSTIPGASMLK
jgi:hypothetical protein